MFASTGLPANSGAVVQVSPYEKLWLYMTPGQRRSTLRLYMEKWSVSLAKQQLKREGKHVDTQVRVAEEFYRLLQSGEGKAGSKAAAVDQKAADAAIRNKQMARTARIVLRAAGDGTAATMLSKIESDLPRIEPDQVTLWQPLLNIIRQAAEQQSRRENESSSGGWAAPLTVGLIVGAALCWAAVRLNG